MITWIMILILWGVIGLFGIVIALEDACSMSCFERWSYKQGAAFLFCHGANRLADSAWLWRSAYVAPFLEEFGIVIA